MYVRATIVAVKNNKYYIFAVCVCSLRDLTWNAHAPYCHMWPARLYTIKQWQTTPKNLPRVQRTRAIPVAWLSSGLCPNRPKGWIPIIIKNSNLINCTVYEKKNHWTQKKRNLIFLTAFVWNISHSKKKWARYDQKYILVFMYSTRYSCSTLMKLEFSRQIFQKYPNI